MSNALATRFGHIIREWLTAEQVEEVNYLNTTAAYSHGACASHNFCDANMAMFYAFKDTFGRDMVVDSQADCNLCNAAWDVARAAKFGVIDALTACKMCERSHDDCICSAPVTTLADFVAKRKEGRLADIYFEASFNEEIGFVYAGGSLFIEDTVSWDGSNDEPHFKGRWFTSIENKCYQSNDLAEIEAILFNYAVAEQIAAK